ncbi:MAG: hypothetical protein BJ554DRAFT_6314 [Olpidium bornovanus]|uniref:Uncharacterized protein n=1 Tax=Olpidium bornovanus TaxID=278681 RepID=A0A8H7ZXZ8_9FUNG|nr:MAG: hypothetical protein BJ554DRAFT_6314 [Olpidium bornovanus]
MIIYALVVQLLELVPLGADNNGVSTLGSLVRVRSDVHLALDGALVRDDAGLGEVEDDLARLDLGIVDHNLSALLDERLADLDGGRLPGVPGVLLEGEAQHGDALGGDRREQAVDDAAHEAGLLVLVQQDDLVPVVGDLAQVELLGEVHEVEDVLLEARASEPDRGLEEAAPDAGVQAAGVGHLVDVRARRLADGRQGVDARDALGEEGPAWPSNGERRQQEESGREGVSGRPHQFRQLRRPQVHRDYALGGDPARIDVAEQLLRLQALGGLKAADQDAVREHQVPHRRAFGEELGVGQDVEADAGVRVGFEDRAHRLRRAAGHGRLLHDDLGGPGDFGDPPGRGLHVAVGV